MKHTNVAAAFAALLAATLVSPAHGEQTELEQLKAQLRALQARVEQLEQQQKVQAEAQAPAAKPESPPIASGGEPASRVQWKGDLRYRNETIDQAFTADRRNRDRIRVRAGFAARVNDTLRVEVQAATDEPIGSNGDARSSNVTLSDANSRKRLDLDLAYAEWMPNAAWRATFGKMRYPWERPTGALFFDNDVNPEGIALGWKHNGSGLFANAFYTHLAERSSMADSTMSGAQVGWRGEVARGTRLTLAAAYFDHGAVKGYNAVQAADIANAYGNSTSTDPALCRPGIAACIANDFNVAEVFGEIATQVAGRPLAVFVDLARNSKADLAPAAASGSSLDTAYSAGFQYGRVSAVRSWEVGYLYQHIENDALYGQWVDSDFGGGNTGSRGHVFRVGYGLGRNFRINGAYFLNETNIDVPATVNGASIFDRAYKRLQLDINMSF